jgi:hypothetical protein
MANRHGDFDELVASQFEGLEFSQTYLMLLINEEGLTLEEALRQTIISMGLQAFAGRADLSIQYVSDFVNKRRKFTTDSIDKYLQKAFQLKVKFSVDLFEGDAA